MEILDVLDSEGNKTGLTIEKGQKLPEGCYLSGADVWIINYENKILIQKRSPQKRLQPNVWAMTGGSIIKGETSLQTIERETYEELGIKINVEDAKWVNRHKADEVWIDTYLLRQDINLNNIVMEKEEVSEVKWASYEEIEKIFKEGNFIKERWEYIKDIIQENL